MKRIIPLLILLLCLPLYPKAQEKIYTPDNLPKVHLQNKYRYLCDPEGIISPAVTDSIDRMLYRLEQQTGIETVVAVVPSIGETECFDFCHELLNSWGVGKKGKDNGLVILLVTDQRCIQFYTGYGLEGPLPDAICKRIQTRYMIPYLKDERWSEGMLAGIRATCARLDGSMENNGTDSADDGELGTVIFLFLLIIVAGIYTIVAAARRATRCPHCKKHKLQRAGSQTISFHDGVKTEEVTYICQNCGHIVKRREQHGQSNNRGHRGGGWGGPVIFGGGGFSGFGGGGGFSGGSFGGGSGGGGGAGSRF